MFSSFSVLAFQLGDHVLFFLENKQIGSLSHRGDYFYVMPGKYAIDVPDCYDDVGIR